ncbi:MAG: inverse autotransporter beta domain-containing protein [Verrucomicrobia bacterium]|nr:inverse autotransporter beta domain-containing protein [Verrucomicrobiota bacterium]
MQGSNGYNSERWNKKPIPKRVTAFGVVGNGIGYDGGYTGLDVMFAPEYPAFAVMPFIEAQGIFIFENQWAANLGVGGRSLSDKIPAMVGFNAFYSFREGDQGSYHQLGLGGELIGRRWELNANAYIPLGKTHHTRKCVWDDYIGDFKAVRRKKERSLFGGNAALSVLAVKAGDFMLYASGGPYFLTGKSAHPQVWGGQVAIQPQYGDYFALSFIVSSDNFWGTLYQGGFVISLPLYQFTKLRKPRVVTNRQIYQPVKRMIPIIPLEERCCWKSNF